ncbi:hypothetical protein AVEN_67128-1 [Araneus ventricosus]|uniref:Uncharacterized protein n=1 Tax=Araneus ventricosus TaxID=182803 RepID=A0A4Y2S3Q5_ARAVE|nr:hypothetical protein AVEN_67128-1 [Araneus ventricosus]
MSSHDNQIEDQPLLEGYFAYGKNEPWAYMTLSKRTISWKVELDDCPKKKEFKGSIHMSNVIAATPCDCSESKPANYCYYCRKLEFRSDFVSPESYPSYPRYMRLHYITQYGRHMVRLGSQIFQPANITTLKQWLDTTQQVISGIVCLLYFSHAQ